MMIKAFRNNTFIKRIIENNKLKLGRWSTNDTKEIQIIKSHQANTDHCGDIICGQPIKNKIYFKDSKK
jgi:hypothetical protein